NGLNGMVQLVKLKVLMTADVRTVIRAVFRLREIAELVAQEFVTGALRRDRIEQIAGIHTLRFDVRHELIFGKVHTRSHNNGERVRLEIVTLIFQKSNKNLLDRLEPINEIKHVTAALLKDLMKDIDIA